MMKPIEHVSPLLRESCVEMRHPSGLRIFVCQKPMRGAYAYFATRFGSLDCTYTDRDGQILPLPDGTAHFLEHKLFDATPTHDPSARFSALGVESNAYTSYEKTVYFVNATAHMEEAIEELLYFVTHPCFTEESVKKEQGIIAEEIRMYADNPWECCYQQLLLALYHKNAVRREILGTQKSINKLTPALLQTCYECYYDLSNMALTVCGSISPEEVYAVADRVLPKTPAPPRNRTRYTAEEPQNVKKETVRRQMPLPKPIFYIGIKDTELPGTPEELLRRDAAMSLLSEVLFSTAGDFYGTLLEEGLITPSFSAGYSISPRFAFHCIGGESDAPEVVLERVRTHMQSVLEHGIDEEELERCRRVLYADEIRDYDSTEEIAADLLYSALGDTPLFSYPQILKELTARELLELLSTLLREGRISLSVVEPPRT